VTGVTLCPEEQANAGTCPPESLIGETTVAAGVGSDPVSVKGGKVYITETYAGPPFGLLIVNPVKAGPFDLRARHSSNPNQQPSCDCVVVRAKIEVNPLTVTTDPTGPHSIPHVIDGIPVEIQKVNVLINREHLTFNPTNRNPIAVTGTINSDPPKQLPTRLTTLQKTRLAALSEANPTSYPAPSIVGHAKIITPSYRSPQKAQPTSSATETKHSRASQWSSKAMATIDLIDSTFIKNRITALHSKPPQTHP